MLCQAAPHPTAPPRPRPRPTPFVLATLPSVVAGPASGITSRFAATPISESWLKWASMIGTVSDHAVQGQGYVVTLKARGRTHAEASEPRILC